MKKILAGMIAGISVITIGGTEGGSQTAMQWIRPSMELAQAIGAELVDEPEASDAASNPVPEAPPGPVAPDSAPDAPRPKPVISDTTA